MRILCVLGLSILAACGNNGASAASTDPLQCSVTFEKYAILARLNGDDRLSKGLRARQSWYMEKVRALPPEDRSDARIKKLSEEADRAEDKDLGLMKSCMEQQDADPEYKKWLLK